MADRSDDLQYDTYVRRFMAIDARIDGVENKVESVTQRVVGIEATRPSLIEGVSNFRTFQAQVQAFILEYKVRDDERKQLLTCQEKSVKDALDTHNKALTTRLTLIGLGISVLMAIFAGVNIYMHLHH